MSVVVFLGNIHLLAITCEIKRQSCWLRYACVCAEMQSAAEEQKDRMTENYSGLSANDMLKQGGSSLSGSERVGRWRGCRLRARLLWGSVRLGALLIRSAWQVHVHKHTHSSAFAYPLSVSEISLTISTQPQKYTQNAPHPLA